MLRALVFSVVTLSCGAVSAQFGGPVNDVYDCPEEYLGEFNGMHHYMARSCANPGTPVLAISSKKVTCPVACIGFVCSNSIYGGGPGEPKPKTPPPVTKFYDEPEPWQDWEQLMREGMDGQNACSPHFDIEDIRNLQNCKLVPAKQYQADFKKLLETIPGWLDDFLKANDYDKQQKMIIAFNNKMNGIFKVSIPGHDRYANPLRLCDYPTQMEISPDLTLTKPVKSDNKGKYKRDPKDVTPEDLGIVKVEDGDQTLYFRLGVINVKSSNGMHPVATIRTGVQVPPEQDVKKTAKFIGANCWTHKLEFEGKLFLVTSKDQRQAATK